MENSAFAFCGKCWTLNGRSPRRYTSATVPSEFLEPNGRIGYWYNERTNTVERNRMHHQTSRRDLQNYMTPYAARLYLETVGVSPSG